MALRQIDVNARDVLADSDTTGASVDAKVGNGMKIEWPSLPLVARSSVEFVVYNVIFGFACYGIAVATMSIVSLFT